MGIYKHTQIGYLMLLITLAMLVLFVWLYMTALAEPASVDSGPNLAVTAVMAVILFILASFATLTVSIDKNYFRLKFGYGIFSKTFPLKEIISARAVKNRWYYGWGIKVWFWPYMWIYNVSGFDAVEIILRNGKIYRVGTDTARGLELAIKQAINT